MMERSKGGIYLPESVTGKGLSAPPGEEKKEEEVLLPEKYSRSDCNTCHGQGTVKTLTELTILCHCVNKRIQSNKGPRR